MGWKATVLTAEVGQEPCDPAMLDRVPVSTLVSRVPSPDIVARLKRMVPMNLMRGAVARTKVRGSDDCERIKNLPTVSRTLVDWITGLLTTPDSRTGWILPAVREGLRLLRQRKPEVIYSTSPCLSAHLVAVLLKRWSRIPWVADFRDPWRDNPFRSSPFRSIEAWDCWLERLVLRQADHVIFNTSTAMNSAVQRMPWLKHKTSTIGNGFDEELLIGIRPRRMGAAGEFILTHAGEFYGRRTPHVLFSAIAGLQRTAPDLAAKLRVVLLGPRDFNGKPLEEWAREAGVASLIRVLGQKCHAETLSYLAGSDAVLIVGASGVGSELQVPNKLYEYLALRRPILAAVSESNPTREVLSTANALAWTCSPEDVAGFMNALANIVTIDGTFKSRAWSGTVSFERKHRAAELCNIFERWAPSKTQPLRARDTEIIVATRSARRSSLVYREGNVEPAEPWMTSAVCSSIQPD